MADNWSTRYVQILTIFSVLLLGFYPVSAKSVKTVGKTTSPPINAAAAPVVNSPNPPIATPTMTAKNETSQDHEGVSRWVILAPAIPTVFVFIFVVILIALKNFITDRYSFDRSMPDFSDDETDGKVDVTCSKCCKRGKNTKTVSKEHYKKELYDHMWKDWQEQRGLKKKHGQRKSSQIVLEGFSSSSPRTLARKHLALNTMSPEESTRRPSALGTLIKLSSRAAMASTIPEGDEDALHRTSSKDLSEDKQLLLPPKDTRRLSFRELPIWQQDEMRKIDEESDESGMEQKDNKKGKKVSRTGSSSSFKYRKLSRQTKVNAEDSDSDGSYDCVQHIQHIIGASKDDLDADDGQQEKADEDCNEKTPLRKITAELLPLDLHETLADMDRWPESAM